MLLVVAVMLTSLCTQFYQFLLCQGILLGTACGLIFAPSLSVVGHYFFRRRAMAMAYASTGSTIGGTLFPVVLTRLIPDVDAGGVGFAWAQRATGFICLFLLLIAAVTIRPGPFRRTGGSLILLEAFASPAYSLQVLGLFLVVLGFFTPYFYVAAYAQAHGVSTGLASYLFAVVNAGSFAGRVLGGTFAQHVGQFNVVTLACYASAVLLFAWLSITSTAGLVVFCVLYGASSGIIIALMMSTVAHCAPRPTQVSKKSPVNAPDQVLTWQQIGAYIGQLTFIIGFAGLAGAPITGALIGNEGDYARGIIFSASVIMAGAIVFTVARYYYAKDKWIA